MPTDVTVALQSLNALPHDRFINTLHFDGDDWGSGLVDELWGHYKTFFDLYGGNLAGTGHEVKCYHPGPNPGGPYFSKKVTFPGGAKSSGGPTEVAICLSYPTVDDFAASTPRRRGRIYLGPLTDTATQGNRPNGTLRSKVLDLGAGIAQVGLASNVTWMMKSQTDNSYHKIEVVSVDDAWDIQRRRGLAPTTRESRDVQ